MAFCSDLGCRVKWEMGNSATPHRAAVLSEGTVLLVPEEESLNWDSDNWD